MCEPGWEGREVARGRGRDRILSSLHDSTEPDARLDLMTLRSSPELKSRVRQLTD